MVEDLREGEGWTWTAWLELKLPSCLHGAQEGLRSSAFFSPSSSLMTAARFCAMIVSS